MKFSHIDALAALFAMLTPKPQTDIRVFVKAFRLHAARIEADKHHGAVGRESSKLSRIPER